MEVSAESPQFCTLSLGFRSTIGASLGHYRRHQRFEPHQIEHPSEIIGERRQTKLSADLLQPAHQECALIHPLLDGPEWMLDRFTADAEDVRALCQAGLHTIQCSLIFQSETTRNEPPVHRLRSEQPWHAS